MLPRKLSQCQRWWVTLSLDYDRLIVAMRPVSIMSCIIRTSMQLPLYQSSLDFYQQCCVSLGKQNYLNNHNDVYTSRLKLLPRTKTIPLQKYLFRMHLSAHSKFVLCNNGEDEDLEHFLLNCPVLSCVRDKYFNIVSKQ